jgi:NitT/TauT family transport system substrate-binding protein
MTAHGIYVRRRRQAASAMLAVLAARAEVGRRVAGADADCRADTFPLVVVFPCLAPNDPAPVYSAPVHAGDLSTRARSIEARARTGVPSWVVAALSLVALLSCRSDRPLREVTLGLSWIHHAQFSGPYYAARHGLYEKEGLRVSFVPAAATRDPLDEFVAGKYDFVIAQPDTLSIARLAGHKVKAVAVSYRVHPLVYVSLESSGIVRPQDFRGKKVGVAYSERLPLMAMLRNLGIDPATVTIVDRPYDFDSLQSGSLDVQACWLINELITARAVGLKLNVVSPYDYGITFYADLLTVRESLIEEDPALVEKFVRATLRGWTEALHDPQESAKLALQYNPQLELPHEVQVLKASAPLIHTGTDRIGWMRDDDWQGMIRTLHEEGVIARQPPAADLYTNRFMEAPQPQR